MLDFLQVEGGGNGLPENIYGRNRTTHYRTLNSKCKTDLKALVVLRASSVFILKYAFVLAGTA